MCEIVMNNSRRKFFRECIYQNSEMRLQMNSNPFKTMEIQSTNACQVLEDYKNRGKI